MAQPKRCLDLPREIKWQYVKKRPVQPDWSIYNLIMNNAPLPQGSFPKSRDDIIPFIEAGKAKDYRLLLNNNAKKRNGSTYFEEERRKLNLVLLSNWKVKIKTIIEQYFSLEITMGKTSNDFVPAVNSRRHEIKKYSDDNPDLAIRKYIDSDDITSFENKSLKAYITGYNMWMNDKVEINSQKLSWEKARLLCLKTGHVPNDLKFLNRLYLTLQSVPEAKLSRGHLQTLFILYSDPKCFTDYDLSFIANHANGTREGFLDFLVKVKDLT